jgi:hypothetical protein
MKAIDPCERWMLRSGEESIERLLARSRAAAMPKVKQPKPKHATSEQRSYLHVVAQSLFRARRPDVRTKVPTRIRERRQAAMQAAANDPLLRRKRG